jgi:hypothetical protein
MPDFGFGQPDDTVIQIGFVVENLEESMAQFTERLGVGPWTVLRSFAGENPRYRGEPTKAVADIALGFAGHLMYELIQPLDELPSVHRDVVLERGYGFHHFGYARPDFDRDVADMRARGYEPVFEASAGGSRVAYFDTRDMLPGMVEFLEAGPALDAAFTAMYEQWRTSRVGK